MTTDTEALVRRAYHYAEGDVLDVRGFIDQFADDGVFKRHRRQRHARADGRLAGLRVRVRGRGAEVMTGVFRDARGASDSQDASP